MNRVSDPGDDAQGKASNGSGAMVSREEFLQWRSPRLGRANPERMDNPVWAWLVKSKLSAYQASDEFAGPSAFASGPGWCFSRFGQSSTLLSDGRLVFIAGEHEDHYDPDFYIYNDVVVQHPEGRLEIFGYPREDFPATDFHSATLVGERIILIGNLGYPAERRPGTTPVLLLDLKTFAVTTAPTTGVPPGWIHGHEAALSEDGQSISVRRGKLVRPGEEILVENIDDWRLWLGDWRWERLTDRRWPRWEFHREDGRSNHLFNYQQAVWEKRFSDLRMANPLAELGGPTLEAELGTAPDLELFGLLYCPPVAFEMVPENEEEHRVFRRRVSGVIVRYVEDVASVQLTVEGELPQPTLDLIVEDLRQKLAMLENASIAVIPL
jgi:hypothetical protein